MNQRICSSSSSEAGSETAGRMHRCRFCSKVCGVGPACQQTHTPCWAGQPPVDRSPCHHDYRTRIPQPADACLACHLTHPSCCHCYAYTVECWGPRHAYMHAHTQQGRRAARCCLGLQHSRRSRCCDGLSGRPIIFNFVTFSTKHGSASDKAYSRLLGSGYVVHANAHRRPWRHFWVFVAQTFHSFLLYIRISFITILRTITVQWTSRVSTSQLVRAASALNCI